jgi:ABC-type multidrug transport system ATPase subunit
VLGYLPQDFGIYPNLNAVEFLEYLAAAKGLSGITMRRRIDELLQAFNLIGVRKRPLGAYSGGMRQRLGIAQALLNDPELLIVDEPTAGLDPGERIHFRNLISEMSNTRVVILSTHVVSDVEACASSIALMREGRVLTHSVPEALLRSVEGRVWELVVPSADLPTVRQRYPVISSAIHQIGGLRVRLVADTSPGASAVAAPPTIEDAYLQWISNGGRGSG